MAARFRNPSEEGCPGTFPKASMTITSRDIREDFSVCELRMRFFERGVVEEEDWLRF